MSRPRVTVVLLSHREHFVPGAIHSVFSQSLPRDQRQLLMNHCPQAYPGKFNDVAACAQGDFIAPLCDDDRLAADYLASCLAVADRGQTADIVFTDRRVYWDVGTPAETAAQAKSVGIGDDNIWHELGPEYGPLPDTAPGVPGYYALELNAETFVRGATLPMTCLIRKTLWDALGGYDPEVPCMDTEFWARAAMRGARVHYIPQPLWRYRKHGNTDVLPYLRAFNRKHFQRFGQDWDHAVEARPNHWVVPEVPVEERAMHYAEAQS